MLRITRFRVQNSWRGGKFLSASISTSETPNQNRDLKLRANVRMLGKTLGGIIKNRDRKVYDSVEVLRALARQVFTVVCIF